jgi:hypothetical protein
VPVVLTGRLPRPLASGARSRSLEVTSCAIELEVALALALRLALAGSLSLPKSKSIVRSCFAPDALVLQSLVITGGFDGNVFVTDLQQVGESPGRLRLRLGLGVGRAESP